MELAHVFKLLEHIHARVEAALLWHVANVAARLLVDGHPTPAHLATIEADHADNGAHGRRFPGAVWAQETEDLAGRDGKREPVEGDDGAVLPPQIHQLEGSTE
jgi:hypothetical protein